MPAPATITAGQILRLSTVAQSAEGRTIPAGAVVRVDHRLVGRWWECTVGPYDQAILAEQALEDAELVG